MARAKARGRLIDLRSDTSTKSMAARSRASALRSETAFWASTSSRDDAERMQRVYPEGKEVAVFHDPVHVGRCTLDRSFNGRRYYQLFAVAVGLVVAGIAIFTGHIHVQN